ncbi:uncharacterized protein LOC133788738 isoform X2 [Humulus lupulus]|nr:uncharacterized protein LOC133788738 isoform X2 [Humulus lupulus]
MSFYSAPTSPTSEFSSTEPTTPISTATNNTYYEDCPNFNLDDFEFDTSLRFIHYNDFEPETPPEHDPWRGDSLPQMSFADELFCDGKVVPLAPPPPLKLPPRLSGKNCGAPVSPRTPRSVLKLPVSRQCLWNDDFDPFMAAIENVREGMRGKNHRRARSLSPLKARPGESVGLEDTEGPIIKNGLNSIELRQPNRSASLRWTYPREKSPMKETGFQSSKERQPYGSASPKRERKSSKVLAEPKGVTIARRVRDAKMDPRKPTEPITTRAQQPTAQTGNSTLLRIGETCTREIKRQKITWLPFKGPSNKKVIDEENKVKDQNAGLLSKATFLSRLSFKSTKKAHYNEDQRAMSQAAKMSIVQYRPRLSLCLGYGSKYVD